LTAEAWIVAILVLAVLIGLWKELASPAVLVFGAVVFLLAIGIIDPAQALSGFSNPAPITVAALFVIARAVSKTGAIEPITRFVLARGGTPRRSLLRLAGPTLATSGFVNNIPLVAMLMPQVLGWARRRGESASRYLMPLSFATILGGLLTVIGTSTNLVVAGQMAEHGLEPMGFFEIGVVGAPIALAGLLTILLVAPRWHRSGEGQDVETSGTTRDYTIEMVVSEAGPAVGQSVEDAGLRHLQGVFLVSIERGDETITPATPTTILHAGDVLRFVGQIANALDLQRVPGLALAGQEHVDLLSHPSASYFTVVVGSDSPLLGQTLRNVGFRERYQAAVVAIHRSGQRVEAKLGGVELRLGDSLLVIADAGFRERWEQESDFLVVAALRDETPPTGRGGPVTLLILVSMVVLAATGLIPILQASLVAAMLLVVLRILTPDEARRAVDLEVIGLIAAAFGLAAAIESSGLASTVADGLVGIFGNLGTSGVLLGVVIATIAMTELVTNNATALLMFPIAIAAAPAAAVDPRGMAVAVAVAASASFLTPIGYQTNTMVYGPGGYRFSDYARLGLPITIFTAAALTIMIPLVYPT
jgi:di/tricarboxylate transporter